MTERPIPAEVRRARKAQLVAWCDAFGLDAEGRVEELRERLIAHLETGQEKAAEAGGLEPEGPRDLAAREETPEAAKAEVAEAKEEEEDEEGEGEEEGATYTPKMKPKLDPALRKALRLRREIAKRRPAFLRQEWFRYARLGRKWRKAMGQHTKVRRHFGYRPNVPSIGYRGPRAARGLHPSGFREVLVANVRDLEVVDPEVQAVRIAATVGMRRRLEIQAAADEKGIRVLNRREEE